MTGKVDVDRAPFIIYADFNCPFCYTYHCRTEGLGIRDQLEWRFIEHMPHASSMKTTQQDIAELASEVTAIRRRAPDIPISMVSMRPKSGPAIQRYCWARAQDPVLAEAFAQAVYRAFWVDQEDISRRVVLDKLWQQVGLPELQKADVAPQIRTWQEQWEKGSFQRRIPSMIDQRGQRLLGLPTISQLSNFLSGRIEEEEQAGLVCVSRRQQGVWVLSKDDGVVKQVQKALQVSCNIFHSENLESLSATKSADLIIVDLDTLKTTSDEVMECVASAQRAQQPLVAFVSRSGDPALEVEAFDRGATDFLHLPVEQTILRARLVAHVQNRFVADQLNRLAAVDHLTGVDNRREFDRTLDREWRSCRRLSHPLAVLMIDIDYFKKFNDHFGHREGDACLRTVAEGMKLALSRPSDYLARYGGEEFVVVLSNTDADGAAHVAKRLVESVAKLGIPHPKSEASDVVTVSVGATAAVPRSTGSSSELVHMADLGLYKAKSEGRNRFVLV